MKNPKKHPQSHITTQEWAAFRRRSLPNDQLLRVSEHVHGCAQCRTAYRTEKSHTPELPSLVLETAGEVSLHLTYEQIAGYMGRPVGSASGTAEWSAVEQHLAFCQSCEMELRELREFDTKAEPATATLAKPAKLARPGVFQSIRNFFAMPQSPAFTGAAAAMAMAGLFIMFSGPMLSNPSTAVGAVTSDSYFVRNALSMQNLTGALLAFAGVSALVYRFTSKNSNKK